MAVQNPNVPRFEPVNLSSKTPIPTSILTDSRSLETTSDSHLLKPTPTTHSSITHRPSYTSTTPKATHSGAAETHQAHGIPANTLIVAIVIPLVLIAILIPLIILLCYTSRRRRQKRNRCSHHSEPKPRMRSPTRQKELLAHRPRGKYGPSLLMRRPDSFSGFDFNFSRPRTVLSAISVRSPKATTPMNATRSNTQASAFHRPSVSRRPALSLLSKYASQEPGANGKHVPSPSSPPPPYIPVRPMTLAHPYIPPPIETPQLPDTPRSLSPQLQVATPMEIQRLSGPYAPISQVLRPPQEAHSRAHNQSPPFRHSRSPLADHSSSIAQTSANLQSPFVPSTSPAPTDISGFSFDPSLWIAAYERDSVVTPLDRDDETQINPHQLV
ncbi:MAG: hypothetical protein Q9191_004936 [Dirinaria sp. TL-2023a]